jgi:hypothetical protein
MGFGVIVRAGEFENVASGRADAPPPGIMSVTANASTATSPRTKPRAAARSSLGVAGTIVPLSEDLLTKVRR